MGGFGKSDCKDGDRNRHPLNNFANNNGWFDDTSDGPVTASVTLENGNSIPVKDNSWIIVAPPKFAPYHYPIVTLYDTMKQVAIDENWIPKPNAVSFMNDIFPILYRVAQYRWVNKRAHSGHGESRGGDFLQNIKILSDNKSQDSAKMRKRYLLAELEIQSLMNPDTQDEEKMAEARHRQDLCPLYQVTVETLLPLKILRIG